MVGRNGSRPVTQKIDISSSSGNLHFLKLDRRGKQLHYQIVCQHLPHRVKMKLVGISGANFVKLNSPPTWKVRDAPAIWPFLCSQQLEERKWFFFMLRLKESVSCCKRSCDTHGWVCQMIKVSAAQVIFYCYSSVCRSSQTRCWVKYFRHRLLSQGKSCLFWRFLLRCAWEIESWVW